MSLLCPIFRYLLLVKWTFYQLAINIFIGCILHFPSWWPDRESVPHKHIREASWLQDKDYQPRKVQVIPFGPGLWFQEINTKHFPNLNQGCALQLEASVPVNPSLWRSTYLDKRRRAAISNGDSQKLLTLPLTRWPAWVETNSWWLLSCSTVRIFLLRNWRMLSELKLLTANIGLFVDHDDLHNALTMLFSDYAAIWREPLRQDPGLVQSMQVHFLLVLRLPRTRRDRCGKGPTNSFGDEGLFSFYFASIRWQMWVRSWPSWWKDSKSWPARLIYIEIPSPKVSLVVTIWITS